MLNPIQRVDDHIVDVEREVVRNELRQRGETESTSSIFGWVQEAVFPPGHPYHHPVIGTHDSLDSIKVADIEKFVRLHYRLDNMTMMIVGDVDLATIGKTLAETVPQLAGDPKNPVTPNPHRLPTDLPEPPEPPPHDGFYRHEGQVSTPEIWMGWSLPGGYRVESDLVEFVNQVMNAELQEAVGEDRDIFAAGSGVIQGTRASLLYCIVKLREGKHPERSAEHVLNQLYKMWNPATSAIETKLAATVFAKMRIEASTGLALAAESPFARASATAEFAHFTGDPAMYSRKIKAMAEMEEARIGSFAYRYLKRDRARMVYVTPLPPSAQVRGGASGVGATDENAKEAAFTFDPAAVRQLAHPAGLASQLQTFKLPNGLEVVLGRRAAVPMVSIALGFHGGTADADPPGIADLADFVLAPASKLHGRPGDFGARYSRGIGIDMQRVQIKAGAGNLENMLAILSDQLTSLRVESGATDSFKKYVASALKKEEEKPEERADRAFWRVLYEDHPYGRRATIDEITKLESSAVERWSRRAVNPRNAVLVIVGDIDVDKTRAAVERWLGPWRGEAGAGELPAPSAAAVGSVEVKLAEGTQLVSSTQPGRVLVTHRAGGTQGELRLGCLLPAADNRTFVMYDVMADMIGKHLFKVVRQQLGASYGLHGRAVTLRGGSSHMLVEGNINNSKLTAALKVIREYWDGLPNGEFDEQEMNRARWALARDYNLRFTSTGAIAGEVLSTRNLGWGIDAIDRYPDALASITKADLQRAFRVCRESSVLSLVGDQTTVNAALKESWR
jgi:zinc protease